MAALESWCYSLADASTQAGWICGRPGDYDREYTVDLAQLLAFLVETQPDAASAKGYGELRRSGAKARPRER